MRVPFAVPTADPISKQSANPRSSSRVSPIEAYCVLVPSLTGLRFFSWTLSRHFPGGLSPPAAARLRLICNFACFFLILPRHRLLRDSVPLIGSAISVTAIHITRCEATTDPPFVLFLPFPYPCFRVFPPFFCDHTDSLEDSPPAAKRRDVKARQGSTGKRGERNVSPARDGTQNINPRSVLFPAQHRHAARKPRAAACNPPTIQPQEM